jgi:Uma2 family endonuclease
MGMPRVHRRWTAEDVRQLMDESRPWPRYELLDGELVVTPAPGVSHQVAVGELFAALHSYLEREPVGMALASPADLQLLPEQIVQPDVFVVPFRSVADAERSASWKDIQALLLAVEVVSPSSARTDRVEKRDHYLDAGVPEYWVVDLEGRAVERWVRGRERPEVVRGELAWTPAGTETAFAIDLPGFFAKVRAKSLGLRDRTA